MPKHEALPYFGLKQERKWELEKVQEIPSLLARADSRNCLAHAIINLCSCVLFSVTGQKSDH